MTSQLKPRMFTTTLRQPTALATSALLSTVRDYFVVPFDCRLKGVFALGQGQAGTTASAATMVAPATAIDTTLTATTVGVTGNAITFSMVADSASVKASLDLSTVCGNIDTVIQAATAGNTGNMIRIVIDAGGSAKAGEVSEDLLSKIVYFHLYSTTTVADFETLVASATLLGASGVKTAGTAANVYVAAEDNILLGDDVHLSGGYLTSDTLANAGLDLATCCEGLSTTIVAVAPSATIVGGDDGNRILVTLVGGASANAGAIAEDLVNHRITIQAKTGGTTAAMLHTLLDSCTLVQCNAEGAGTFDTNKDSFTDVPLTAGVSNCHVTLSGTAVTAKCVDTKTTIANMQFAINNQPTIAALVTAASGTGATTWTAATDTTAATNLSGGCDDKPTITVYNNGAAILADHMNTTTAITTYYGDLNDGFGATITGNTSGSYKLAAGDKLTMRCTTTSGDGVLQHATCVMVFEY